MARRTVKRRQRHGASGSPGESLLDSRGVKVGHDRSPASTATGRLLSRRLSAGLVTVVAVCLVLLFQSGLLDRNEADRTPAPGVGQEARPSQASADRGRPKGVSGNTEQGTVVEIIDGDTMDVEVAGDALRVRLIGIDTPETDSPYVAEECFGAEATEYTTALLLNQTVWLEGDVSDTDPNGRLLRYLWVVPDDGSAAYLVNESLVAEGYAEAKTYRPDVKHQTRLDAAEAAARDANLGLWGACD